MTSKLVDLVTKVDSIRKSIPSSQYLFIVSPSNERVLILDSKTHQPVIMVVEYTTGSRDFCTVTNTNRLVKSEDLNLVKAVEFAFDINRSPILLSLAFSSDDKQLYIGADADSYLNRKTNAN